MRSSTWRLEDLRNVILNLGFVGENLHTRQIFDCKKMFDQYPNASVSMTVTPPEGEPYPGTIERDGDLVIWDVRDSDMVAEGDGEIQLVFIQEPHIARSYNARTHICRSQVPTGSIPSGLDDYITRANQLLDETEAATAAAEAAAEHQPIIDDNGYWAVWDADAEEYVATEYKAQGTDGHDGVGIVSIEKTGTSGLVDTYTITFTSGNPVTYTVTNGRDADPAELIDDTSTATNKTWSAKKISDENSSLLTEINSIIIDVPSKNLYDKNSCNPQDGKVYKANLSGLTDSSSYAVTGKMPVDGDTEYIFSAGGANVKYVVYFSGASGETPISEVQIAGSSFTTPANCTYVDFELFAVSHTTEQYNAAINAGQLERGNTVTPYEPYGTVKSFSLPAKTTDEGKALSPKTVSNGKVTEWQYVEVGGGSSVTVDDDFSDSSTNPVQNKVITKVVDSITEKDVSPNLYDKNTCNPQDGKVYGSNHQYQSNSSYAVTGKMPVEPSTQYIFYAGEDVNVKYLAQWKGETGETFVSETNISGSAFTTGSETTFVEFEIFARSHTTEEYNAAINAAMLVQGSVVPSEYQPYGKVDYTVPTNALKDAEAVEGAKNYTVKRSLINLYDKSLAVDNKVFNTNKLVGNTSFAFSGLIPVEPNAQYCYSIQKGLEYGYISAWYQRWDSTGAFIDEVEGGQSTSHTNQMQTTATTAYVSFCIYFGAAHTTEAFNDAIDTLMVVEGCQRPLEYSAYNYEPVVDHLKLDTMYRDNADRFREKRWIAFGTSVTYQDSKAYTEGVANGEVVRGYVGDIARRKPMLVTNSGVSGSTLAGSDTRALINRYQNYTYTDYDFVTIEYGINDFGNDVPVGTASDAAGTSTFAACLKTIIEYILNANPIVGLIICTDPDVRGTTMNNNGNTLKDYTDVMLEIAAQYRLPVCDWFYHSGINSITKGNGSSRYFLTQAGTHPSVYGHMRMGAMLNQVFDSMLC